MTVIGWDAVSDLPAMPEGGTQLALPKGGCPVMRVPGSFWEGVEAEGQREFGLSAGINFYSAFRFVVSN